MLRAQKGWILPARKTLSVDLAASRDKATEILEENRQKLDEPADYLYEKETITGEEFMQILNR